MTTYLFGPRDWGTSFCKHCGVTVIRNVNVKSDIEYAAMESFRRDFIFSHMDLRPLNVKTLNEFSIKESGLKITQNDGWSQIKPVYVNP